jgi:hypothetical protein
MATQDNKPNICMSIEYHGWIALATSRQDWSDGDFEDGFQQVAKALVQLRPDEGHEPLMEDCELLPRIVYLKGMGAKSLDLVFRVIETVGCTFDRAYGELSAMEHDLRAPWNSSLVSRYLVINGALREERK